ncbi:hypothetical protein ACWGCC_30495 [Streptomyces nigrescens]
MLPTLVTAALAIVGTLLGAVVSGRFQERAADRAIRVSTGEALRRDRLEAVTALACAAADHRRAMWMRADADLAYASADWITALRAESHTTRSAINRPMVALHVLITDPAVRAAADRMVTLTYAMRNADTTETLTTAREAAKAAHTEFVETAAGYLTAA